MFYLIEARSSSQILLHCFKIKKKSPLWPQSFSEILTIFNVGLTTVNDCLISYGNYLFEIQKSWFELEFAIHFNDLTTLNILICLCNCHFNNH